MSSLTIHGVESNTDSGVKPSAQTIRLDRAAALVAVARLIVEHNLPAPHDVWFTPAATVISTELTFDSAEAAEVWASHLGFGAREQVYVPKGEDAPIRMVNADGPWSGQTLRLAGSTTVSVSVSADETAVSVTA